MNIFKKFRKLFDPIDLTQGDIKKVFTLSHRACFLLIFMCFECEGFDFKAFTLGVKACEVTFPDFG